LAATFFTIGHSNRSCADFLSLLREHKVTCLVDIRKITRSRANSQFDAIPLSLALGEVGITYQQIPELGGFRGKSYDVPPELNGNWRNAAFHRYADYALSESFQQGLLRLLQAGLSQCCAIMCAEVLWWRCHRRIVSDYLLANGQTVFHIMGPKHVVPARLTDGAVIREDRSVVYPVAAVEPVEVMKKSVSA
jgi:uncharacterized protein (DUF488 family)